MTKTKTDTKTKTKVFRGKGKTQKPKNPSKTAGKSAQKKTSAAKKEIKNVPPVNSAMDASFSMLLMSVASSAAMAMGLSPHPQTGQLAHDRQLARFNIDLLMMLESKTQGNLSNEEHRFLSNVISDLQLKFVAMKGSPQ